jgi:hypothetical protein
MTVLKRKTVAAVTGTSHIFVLCMFILLLLFQVCVELVVVADPARSRTYLYVARPMPLHGLLQNRKKEENVMKYTVMSGKSCNLIYFGISGDGR